MRKFEIEDVALSLLHTFVTQVVNAVMLSLLREPVSLYLLMMQLEFLYVSLFLRSVVVGGFGCSHQLLPLLQNKLLSGKEKQKGREHILRKMGVAQLSQKCKFGLV